MSGSGRSLVERRRAVAAVEYVNNSVMFCRAVAASVERASWPVGGARSQPRERWWRRRAGAGFRQTHSTQRHQLRYHSSVEGGTSVQCLGQRLHGVDCTFSSGQRGLFMPVRHSRWQGPAALQAAGGAWSLACPAGSPSIAVSAGAVGRLHIVIARPHLASCGRNLLSLCRCDALCGRCTCRQGLEGSCCMRAWRSRRK